MPKNPETIFTEKVVRDLNKHLKFCWVEKIQQVGKCGTPDLLLCIRGYFVALEIKAERGKPSKIQLLKCSKIRRAKGKAFIVYPCNWKEVLEQLILIDRSII